MWPIYLLAILSTVVSLPIVFPCVEISRSKYACTTPQWSISGDIVLEITASGNVEHSVHASSFALVPYVKWIDISNTYISTITPTWFASNPELQYLDLQYNTLTVIVPGLFDFNTRLEILLLGHNNILTFESTFVNLGTLSVESNFALRTLQLNASMLVSLKISDTDLETLPDISSYSMLQILDAQNLKIQTIVVSAFASNRILNTIDLSGCTNITIFPPVASTYIFAIILRNTSVTCLDTPSELLAGRTFTATNIIIGLSVYTELTCPWCAESINPITIGSFEPTVYTDAVIASTLSESTTVYTESTPGTAVGTTTDVILEPESTNLIDYTTIFDVSSAVSTGLDVESVAESIEPSVEPGSTILINYINDQSTIFDVSSVVSTELIGLDVESVAESIEPSVEPGSTILINYINDQTTIFDVSSVVSTELIGLDIESANLSSPEIHLHESTGIEMATDVGITDAAIKLELTTKLVNLTISNRSDVLPLQLKSDAPDNTVFDTQIGAGIVVGAAITGPAFIITAALLVV